jgi:hypothetical protein
MAARRVTERISVMFIFALGFAYLSRQQSRSHSLTYSPSKPMMTARLIAPEESRISNENCVMGSISQL